MNRREFFRNILAAAATCYAPATLLATAPSTVGPGWMVTTHGLRKEFAESLGEPPEHYNCRSTFAYMESAPSFQVWKRDEPIPGT